MSVVYWIMMLKLILLLSITIIFGVPQTLKAKEGKALFVNNEDLIDDPQVRGNRLNQKLDNSVTQSSSNNEIGIQSKYAVKGKKQISNKIKGKINNKMTIKLPKNEKKQMSKELMGYSPRYDGDDLPNRHPLYWLWWWNKFAQETQGDSGEEQGTTPRTPLTTNTPPTRSTTPPSTRSTIKPPRTTTKLPGTTTKPTITTKPPPILTTKPPPNKKCECGIANEKPFQARIRNGENAERNEYPWIVLLEGRLTYCGGSIISRNTILTAAHCLVDKITLKGYTKLDLLAGYLRVYVGEHDISKSDGEMRYLAVDTKVHPNYKGKKVIPDYDYGIVILAKNLVWSSKVSPICLPFKGKKYGQREAFLAGWGNVRPLVKNQSILKKTTLNTYYNCALCTPRMIGALSRQSSGCIGDNGGPLAVREYYGRRKYYYTVVGIASITSCKVDYPNYFARVTQALNWITDNKKGTDCSKPGTSW